jgi:hypothetical protein
MSLFDKIKDALTNDDEKKQQAKDAAGQAATAAKEAVERLQNRDQGDAEAQRQAEAERQAAEQRAADERAAEAEGARRAAEAVPAVSVARVREVVAHDSDPNTPTGAGLDKELGMLMETSLRRALDQVGLPNNNTDDGSLGTLFLESYSRWQGHLGYSGNDADGVPGRGTLVKLAEATGSFTVVD